MSESYSVDENEQVIWQGYPNKKVLFASQDAILLPPAIALVVVSFVSPSPYLLGHSISIFRLIEIAFIMYLLCGRYIVKAFQKRNLKYVITNQRIYIVKKNTISRELFRSDLDRVVTSVVRGSHHRSAVFYSRLYNTSWNNWLTNMIFIMNFGKFLCWLFSNTGLDFIIPLVTLGRNNPWREEIDPIRFVDVSDSDGLLKASEMI